MPITATQSSPAASAGRSPLQYDGGLTCSINVRDLNKSIAWYQETLGFKLLYRVDELGWCELATGTPGVNVGLSEVEDVGHGGNATLTFGVKSIEHARKLTEQRNVRFDGETRTFEGMVKLATFFDPDGNTLMFYEDLRRG